MQETYDLEMAIVTLLWQGENLFEKMSVLKEEWFNHSLTQSIFRKAKHCFENHIPLDLVIASKELAHEELMSILALIEQKSPSNTNFMSYIRLLSNECAKRKARIIAEKMVSNPTLDLMDELKEALNDAVGHLQLAKLYKDIAMEVIEGYSKFNKTQAILSGFSDLDDAIIGFRPGEIYTFGARPGEGKTSILCQMALNIATLDKKVLLFATEMQSRDIVSGRFFPMESGYQALLFRQPDLIQKTITEFLNKNSQKIESKQLYICDLPFPRLEDIRYNVEKFLPHILIVDYLQRCNPPKAESRRVEISKLVMGIKTIAREYNIPIIVAAQLGRSTDYHSGEPQLSDLLESSSIEAESDVVVLFWRDKEQDLGKFRKIIAATKKNRNGPYRKFNLLLNQETTNVIQEYNTVKNESKEDKLVLTL